MSIALFSAFCSLAVFSTSGSGGCMDGLRLSFFLSLFLSVFCTYAHMHACLFLGDAHITHKTWACVLGGGALPRSC